MNENENQTNNETQNTAMTTETQPTQNTESTNTNTNNTSTGTNGKDSNEILYAVLSYIGFLSLIVLYVIKPKSEFANFHAKQGSNLFIIDLIFSFGGGIIKGVLRAMSVPFVGSVVGLVSTAIWVLNIIGLIYAAQGKQEELPIISKVKIIK